MKISIITATYNSEASVLATVASLAAQTFPRENIEWILVDGASTDKTLELIHQQDFRPDQWVSEPDQGIYDALNKGVRMATGDFIGFLHADDTLASPSVLNRIACALKNSGADALYGDLQYVRPVGENAFSIVRHWESGSYARNKLKWGWMPPHPTLYLKRDVYDVARLKNGDYFDTSFTCAADYDFMMRIFSRYAVEPAYLKMVLVKMRVGGVSNRSLKHIIRKSQEDWTVIRRNKIGHIHTLIWKNLGKVRQFFGPRKEREHAG
jgi:glycosyltransferase